jgi:hypothetical protein
MNQTLNEKLDVLNKAREMKGKKVMMKANATMSRGIETLEPRIAPAKFMATIRPGYFTGGPGFEIVGPDEEIYSVTNIGDFNGDGLNELAILCTSDPFGFDDPATVYVVYGNANGFPPLLDLASLNGTNGFKITGLEYESHIEFSVDGGDLNGDGRADLAIGSSSADGPAGTNCGAAYVIFGTQSAPTILPIGSLNGTNGFFITGSVEYQGLGHSIAIGGSVNGDGFGDLIVGGPGVKDSGGQTPFTRGVAAVVFGKASGFANLNGFASLNGTTGFVINGTSNISRIGTVVNILDDINGDGIAEINVGESRDGKLPLYVGNRFEDDIGFIIFGKSGPRAAAYNIDEFEVPDAIAIKDMRGAEIGSYFRTQDFNGDGITDLLGIGGFVRGGKLFIGGLAAIRTDSGMPSGSYFPEDWKAIGLFQAVPLGETYIDGGDFNGDGILDMVVDGDKASLIFGKNYKGIHFVGGKDSGMRFEESTSVRFIGDINGDGFDDLAVQGQGLNDGPPGEQVSIVFGSDLKMSRDGLSASWTDIDGDLVTLKTTKFHLYYSQFHFAKQASGSPGRTLELFEFTIGNASGTDIIVTVKQNPEGGDGVVHLGRINGISVLGTVSVDGHVGEMHSDFKLGKFVADSLGLMPDGQLAGMSGLHGRIGEVRIKGEVSAGLEITDRIGSLKTGAIADGASITGSGKIGSWQSTSIGDATIELESIGSLVVKGDKAAGVPGDFRATLTLDNGGEGSDRPVLGSVAIAGLVKDATFDVTGSIGKFSAGAMENSKVLAAYQPTSAAAPLSGGIFLTAAAIKRVTITGAAAAATGSGTAFANSSIVAAAIGRVTIPSVDETNGGVLFGIGYRDAIGPVVVNQPSFSFDKGTGGTQGAGDFKVVVL